MLRVTLQRDLQCGFSLRRNIATGRIDQHIGIERVILSNSVGLFEPQHLFLRLIGGGVMSQRRLVAGQQSLACQIVRALAHGSPQFDHQ